MSDGDTISLDAFVDLWDVTATIEAHTGQCSHPDL